MKVNQDYNIKIELQQRSNVSIVADMGTTDALKQCYKNDACAIVVAL